jgi:hypothetical protein
MPSWRGVQLKTKSGKMKEESDVSWQLIDTGWITASKPLGM